MKRILVEEAPSTRPPKLRINQRDAGSSLDGDDVVVDIDVEADAGLGVREVCFGMVCTSQKSS
jgi:hypothetical protein